MTTPDDGLIFDREERIPAWPVVVIVVGLWFVAVGCVFGWLG